MKGLLGTALVVAGMAAAVPAPAQSGNAVAGACVGQASSEAGCRIAIETYIAALDGQGLTRTERDAAVGALAARLAQAAPANPSMGARALEIVSTTVASSEQSAAIRAVAQTLASGRTIDAAPTARSASPN